jgi:hypothetical protein
MTLVVRPERAFPSTHAHVAFTPKARSPWQSTRASLVALDGYARNSRSNRRNVSGVSSGARCPAPAMTTRRDLQATGEQLGGVADVLLVVLADRDQRRSAHRPSASGSFLTGSSLLAARG